MLKNGKDLITRIQTVLDQTEKMLVIAGSRYVTGAKNDYERLSVGEKQQLGVRLKQTIIDVTPVVSEYHKYALSIKPTYVAIKVETLHGILLGVKQDYEGNFFRGINELINAEIFTDILDQAEHLHSQNYFRASVVVAGVALESQLRKLAEANSISITNENGFVKANLLNTLLYKNGVYDKTLSKSIGSWIGLRNDAAHPDSQDINEGLIGPMIMGIRNLIEKYPA